MSYLPVVFESIFDDVCRVPDAEITFIQSLWIGKKLSVMEKLCISSFLQNINFQRRKKGRARNSFAKKRFAPFFSHNMDNIL